jgi:hypothetical protein
MKNFKKDYLIQLNYNNNDYKNYATANDIIIKINNYIEYINNIKITVRRPITCNSLYTGTIALSTPIGQLFAYTNKHMLVRTAFASV